MKALNSALDVDKDFAALKQRLHVTQRCNGGLQITAQTLGYRGG